MWGKGCGVGRCEKRPITEQKRPIKEHKRRTNSGSVYLESAVPDLSSKETYYLESVVTDLSWGRTSWGRTSQSLLSMVLNKVLCVCVCVCV